jgi:Macrocin-O-methyltransferase (TylF)
MGVTIARRIVPMSIYLRRRPLVPQLQPERLRLYLDTLSGHRDQVGAVLEVGCFRGATTVQACQHLRSLGAPRPYMIIDTFAGFVPEQFDEDEQIGTPADFRSGFSENPKLLVERTMRHYGLDEVRLVQADICELDPDVLPERISVCLMDVDLAVPIHVGLGKVWQRMAPEGVILVDDCDKQTDWRGARVGYQRFCKDHGVRETYQAGFGLLYAASAVTRKPPS